VATDITDRRHVQQALGTARFITGHGQQDRTSNRSRGIELKQVINSATNLIQKNFGYYHVGFFIPDWNRGELVMRSSSGFFSELS